MIIYSESFHVEHEVEKDWIEWVKSNLIPKIQNTEKFKKAVFTKVISHSDESGNTYSMQYFIENKKMLDDFHKHHSAELSLLIFKKFGQKVLSFKTELEIIETFDF